MKKRKISRIKRAKWKFAWHQFLRYCFFLVFVMFLGAAVWVSRSYGVARFAVQEDKDIEECLRSILPKFDNHPLQDGFWLGETKVYPALRIISQDVERVDQRAQEIGTDENARSWTQEVAGYAFEVKGTGYRGEIRMMVGIDLEGKVLGVRILADEEPPFFGKLFKEQENFFNSLIGQGEETLKLADEGGSIHAVSSATITSRGVVAAVHSASEFYNRNRDFFKIGAGMENSQ